MSSSAVIVLHESRVVLIVMPADGVPDDVFADGREFAFIADNVLVVPTLPQSRVKWRQTSMPHA